MTIYLNLFGGPGVSKSTSAAGIFYNLKNLGVNCELIQEYAKDKTWQGEEFVLACQPYITAKQLFRQHRLEGKVDIAITDAPLLHGLVYPGQYTGANFDAWLVETFHQFDNLNIFLKRNNTNHPFQQAGRSQSEAQSMELDTRIELILHKYAKTWHEIEVDSNTADRVVHIIEQELYERDRLHSVSPKWSKVRRDRKEYEAKLNAKASTNAEDITHLRTRNNE